MAAVFYYGRRYRGRIYTLPASGADSNAQMAGTIQSVGSPPGAPGVILMRKALSPVGTKLGSRQMMKSGT